MSNKTNKEKKKTGRPSLYKQEYDWQVFKLALLGLVDRQIAEFFEVREETINDWKKKHPSFSKHLNEGKRQSNSEVAYSMYRNAIGYSHPEEKVFNNGLDKDGNPRPPTVVPTTKHYPPNVAAGIFFLKNREPELWKDKQEIKQDTNLTVEIVEFNDDNVQDEE
jgi:hypothetical protein